MPYAPNTKIGDVQVTKTPLPSHQALFDALAMPFLEAAKVALDYYDRENCDVMLKDDQSPLTQADLAVDEIICGALEDQFPHIPLVTEERSDTHAQSLSGQPFFLVDPIDGTKEFIQKRDSFTINVGLIDEGEPVFGMVLAPALGTLFVGSVGAYANRYDVDIAKRTFSEPMKISALKSSNDELSVVASRSHLSEETQKFIDANEVGKMVATGSSLKFCTIACGEADVYPRFEPTMEWDTAAGQAVLLAAGGKVDAVASDENSRLAGPLRYGKPDYRNTAFVAYAPNAQFVMPK